MAERNHNNVSLGGLSPWAPRSPSCSSRKETKETLGLLVVAV